MPTFALNFSRPAGEIVAQYYQFLRLGKQGYTDVQGACAQTAQYLAGELEKTGHFDMLYNGDGGLPAVCYSLKNSDQRAYTLYDVSERLRMRGWQIASYPLPENRRDLVVQRVLVRHGMGRDLMELLVEDMQRTIEFLDRNPMTNSEAGPTFHHGRDRHDGHNSKQSGPGSVRGFGDRSHFGDWPDVDDGCGCRESAWSAVNGR